MSTIEITKASDEFVQEQAEKIMEEHKETLQNLAESEANEGYDQPLIMTEEETRAELAAKAKEAEQNKILAAEYRKYVGELKKKLKSHSKNQLVEMIANQAWQFNQLQQMARHIHEKNIELEKQVKGEI